MNKIGKFFRDSQGKIVVWQTPNLPLIGWFLFTVVARIVNNGSLENGFEFLSTALLFTWAYLEITQGASYFRRLLGLTALIFIVISIF